MNIHGLRLFNFVHNTVSALESFHSDVDPGSSGSGSWICRTNKMDLNLAHEYFLKKNFKLDDSFTVIFIEKLNLQFWLMVDTLKVCFTTDVNSLSQCLGSN